MKTALRLGLIALVLFLVWSWQDGVRDITGAIRQAGWQTIPLLCLAHLLSMTLCGLAWGRLLGERQMTRFILARWVREAVSEIAGFLPLSGELAGARLLTRHAIRPALAGALTVVDVTAEVIAQFIFSLVGVGLWIWRYPDSQILQWGLMGLAGSIPVLMAFFFLQRSKMMRFIETLPSRLMPKFWQTPDLDVGLHATIATLYADRRRFASAVGFHLLAWLVSTLEAWLGLLMLGHPMALADVIAMESIIFALRSAAFLIPGALGIQEGGYVLVGAALLLPPPLALALSLLKRGRELTLGLPALLAWHFIERRQG
ncbi:MAG TPA: HpnL family protein [Rhodospirillaceae bacterium]|nr:HpnL family protein [Rhodospirillaceae bacterium]